jgi:hypothetical protein
MASAVPGCLDGDGDEGCGDDNAAGGSGNGSGPRGGALSGGGGGCRDGGHITAVSGSGDVSGGSDVIRAGDVRGAAGQRPAEQRGGGPAATRARASGAAPPLTPQSPPRTPCYPALLSWQQRPPQAETAAAAGAEPG